MSLFTRKILLITGCCHQGSPLRWALPVCKAQYSNTDIQNTVVVVVFFAFFFFYGKDSLFERKINSVL